MTIRPALVVVAALLSALVLAGAASSAYASCGDWLSHADGPHAHTATDAGNSAPANAANAAAAAPSPHRAKRLPWAPCSGPNCRQAPQHPLAPVAPSISIPLAELALLCCPAALASIAPHHSLAADTSPRPARGFPARIDHPPRA